MKLVFPVKKVLYLCTVCPTDIGPTSQPVLVYVFKKTKNVDKKTTWVHKRVQVQVPEYRSRFPSTGPLLVFYIGPGSRVQVQVPKYRFWTMKSPNFLKCHKMILIFNIHLQDCCWSICHASWVIGFESGLRNIDFSQRYQVEKLAQYRWDIRYI